MAKVKGSVALFWASADKILTNGFSLVISVILARLIEPSEYGVIATASIFTILLSLFVEPGMTSALIQKKTVDKLDYSSILSFNLFLGAALYGLLFCFSDAIGKWFGLPVLSSVLKVLGMQVIIGSINSVQIAYVQRNMLFRRYFISSLLSVFVAAVAGIGMAYKGVGVWALVIYTLLRQLLNTIITFFLFRCNFGLKFSRDRFSEMFPFASRILITKFVDQGYVEATQTIISKVYSAQDLALYNKGKSFPDLIVNNLNAALTSVIFPYFSKMQDDNAVLKKSMRTAVKMISFICIPLMIGLLSCADTFVKVVLTEKWINSVPFLQLCCFYNIWVPFSNIIWQALKSIGKSSVVLRLEIVKTLLCISSLVVFLIVLNSPLAIALSISFAYMVSFFVECFVATKHLNYEVKYIVKDFLPSFLLSCVMGGIVILIGKMKINSFLLLLIQIISGVTFYLIATYLFKFPQLHMFLSFLKQKRSVKHQKN